MITHVIPRHFAVSLAALALAHPLLSQCPDGTPPPCPGAAALVHPAPNSVAVLYLDNLSRDTADAFLADGLTEEIIIRLTQVPRLDVKSRYEVQPFHGQAPRDPANLGRVLRAAYLVTGSVQRAGEDDLIGLVHPPRVRQIPPGR